MRDVLTLDRDPVVLAVLVDGEARFGESEIGEGAQGHGDEARPAFDHEGDGRSAMRAKAIGGAVAAVGDAFPDLGFTRDLDLILGPARLRGKGTAAALLAIEAVAHRNAHRLAFA